jgi:hypothetical protein
MNLKSKIFNVEIDEISGTINQILDMRYDDPVDITDGRGRFASTSYTLLSDDITTGIKPRFTPYVSRESVYGKPFKSNNNGIISVNEETGTKIHYSLDDQCLKIRLEQGQIFYSEFGLNFPFNFMSKKGGNWMRQFLISSPFCTFDNRFCFVFLTRPDKKNLLLIAENEVDGYKIDYSEINFGHFFESIKILSSFDKAYGLLDRPYKSVSVRLVPVSDYLEALRYAAALYDVPVVYYKLSSGFIGQQLKVDLIGECTHLQIIRPDGSTYEIFVPETSAEIDLDEYGVYHIIPYNGNVKGLDCSIFAADSWYKLSTKTLMNQKQHYNRIVMCEDGEKPIWEPFGTNYPGAMEVSDKNLCESQMWALAALKYLNHFGYNEKAALDVKNLLTWVTASDPKLYLDMLTIVSEKQQGGPSWFTSNSTRIQEVFNGISILIEAFKFFKERTYLEFAINALNSVLGYCLMPSGEIRRFHEFTGKDSFTDYTTVTCMVMPVVDMANLLRGMKDDRYHVFEEAALKIGEHLCERGYNFPTEGGVSDLTEKEMEDGSISCTALSLLYIYRFLKQDKRFVDFAADVLSHHDAWSMYTHNVHMFRSSLRWWENIWEGDHDGPALNCGHSWSIWRAEAQFHYAIVTGDTERLIDSYNGYMCSFSKVTPDGRMYSHYQCEAIIGGGNSDRSTCMEFRIACGFPRKEDNSLSRYVFARAYDTWFKCTAVIKTSGFEGVLNGCLKPSEEYAILESFAPDFEILFISGFRGRLVIHSKKTISLKCDINPTIIKGESFCCNGMHNITPSSGTIEIKL